MEQYDKNVTVILEFLIAEKFSASVIFHIHHFFIPYLLLTTSVPFSPNFIFLLRCFSFPPIQIHNHHHLLLFLHKQLQNSNVDFSSIYILL